MVDARSIRTPCPSRGELNTQDALALNQVIEPQAGQVFLQPQIFPCSIARFAGIGDCSYNVAL